MSKDSQPEGDKINLPEKVRQEILDNLGAKTVAIKMGNQRKLLAVNDMPHTIHHNVDLRDPSMLMAVWEALQTLFLVLGQRHHARRSARPRWAARTSSRS